MVPLKRALPLALVVVALGAALLPALAPAAAAPAPAAAAWNGHSPGAIVAFAISRDGSTIVAGLPASNPTTGVGGIGTTPNVEPRPDLVVYDFDKGPRFNTSCTSCNGAQLLAVSNDGGVIAAGSTTSTATNAKDLRLLLRSGSTYINASTTWPVDVAGRLKHVALAGDGSYVVALSGSNDTNSNVTLFGRDGSARWIFPRDATGSAKSHVGALHRVAISARGDWIAVAGSFVGANATKGVVYLFTSSGATPVGSATIDSPVTELAMGANGDYLVAGTANGLVANVVRDPFGAINAANVVTVPQPVRALALSTDTLVSTAAVGHGSGVTLLERSVVTKALAKTFETNLTGGITSVSLSSDGRALLAGGSSGTSLFASHNRTALYTIPGGLNGTGLDQTGRRVALATATTVSAFTNHPLLSLVQADAAGLPAATPQPAATGPGQPGTLHVLVKNDGSFADRGELVLPQSSTVGVTANRTQFTLRPGDGFLATVSIVPGNLPPGTYDLVLAARSDVTGKVTNLSVQYTVGARAGVSIHYPGAQEFVVRAGRSVEINFEVRNVGNEGSNVSITLAQNASRGGSWPVTVFPEPGTSFFVARAGSTPGKVIVTIPASAPDGTSNAVRLVARLGTITSQPLDLSFIVNPIVAANMTSETPSRLVTVGNAAHFNLTLKNTGSVLATYTVVYDLDWPDRTPPWNLELTGLDKDGRATLNPGQSKPLALKLWAPEGAPAGSSATAFLLATDFTSGHDLPKFKEYLNLSATVVHKDVVIDQDPQGLVVPGVEAALLAAGAGAVALARRRRLP